MGRIVKILKAMMMRQTMRRQKGIRMREKKKKKMNGMQRQCPFWSNINGSNSIKHKLIKRKMRGRVRKSVLNRRDLLKLNKQKLAKKCNQANIASNGTKQEMVDRLIEKNKKKKNKHQKT